MRRITALLALILGASLLVACSSDNNASKHPDMNKSNSSGEMDSRPMIVGAPEIAVSANALSFTPKEITLKAGSGVNIALTAGDVEHDMYVKGVGHVAHAPKGKTVTAGLQIDKAGSYPFWCTVKGHRAGGMEGTITVT